MRSISIEDLLATPSCSGLALAPGSDRLLTSSDAPGVYNALELSLDGDAPRWRTRSETDSVWVVDYLPDGERFLFLQDSGGDERAHLHLCEADGSTRDLTPWDGVKVLALGWRDDLGAFYFRANRRDPGRMDLYALSPDSLEVELLFECPAGRDLGPMEPSGRRVAMLERRTESDWNAWIHDLDTGATQLLRPQAPDVRNLVVTFEPDGEACWLLTDEGTEYLRLVRRHLQTGTELMEEGHPGDTVAFALSRTGALRATCFDRDAVSHLRLTWQGQEVPVHGLPEGDITEVTLSRDERRVTFLLSTSTQAPAPWVIDVNQGEATPLSTGVEPQVPPAQLAETRHVCFRSYDDLEVPGVLYPAQGIEPGRPVPGLIYVHGGPGGQSRRSYRAMLQYLALGGYEVYAVNNRGSRGYGKTFHSLDRRGHGDKDLDDCVAAREVLIRGGRVDPARIGVLGGSYGGFMVLAALAFRPGAFAAGVDIFGVSNWLRTLREIPAWWESARRLLYDRMGDPDVDEEYLRSISPLFHAEKIRDPLMVLQGANDPRVLRAESDEIVAAVRARGTPVEYLLFEDEGHGFVKTANQVRGYRAIRAFLDRHLGDGTEEG